MVVMDNALDTNMPADMNDLKGVPGGLKKAGGRAPDQLLARQTYRGSRTGFFLKFWSGITRGMLMASPWFNR